ncbi:hypothetical protein AVEN_4752-1 [Araneus ventricosus]|uniref:Uncharacterized protein n=1 Tax=Araneus ventricosus TaxID=182803 RepID=A0A4Y2SJM5_ARAVE|nr:hypothetical protein AVEN_4752-1 [Araneus ventricosus]
MQIDQNQGYARNCRKAISDLQINGGNDALIASRNHELTGYETKIAECEKALITIGPCPLVNCVKHHEINKVVEIAEHGQYKLSTNFTPQKTPKPTISPNLAKTNAMLAEFAENDRKLLEISYKTVSRKNAAKPLTEEIKTAIETSNKFQLLMDVEEEDIPTEPPKTFIPAINLKLTNDYNLTLQEISRNDPETTNKYDRGYIKITPSSLEDIEKIIDLSQ